jgi:hypothetical protein
MPIDESGTLSLTPLFQDEIAFHKKWKAIMVTTYGAITILTIASTSAATVLASLQYGKPAACLTAFATALIAIERSLLFREKWRHHHSILTRLRTVNVLHTLGLVDKKAAVEMYAAILKDYSETLPIESRAT